MSGEIMPIIEAIDFSNKSELLAKLRVMRDSTEKLSPDDRRVVKDMINIAIQEVYYTQNKELMRFKKYLFYRKNTYKKHKT